jgi:predicted transcriptional regulator
MPCYIQECSCNIGVRNKSLIWGGSDARLVAVGSFGFTCRDMSCIVFALGFVIRVWKPDCSATCGLQMNQQNQDDDRLTMTADIVSAFVSNNPVRTTELPELIHAVHDALKKVGRDKAEETPEPALVPAVSIKKSVTDDYLVCLDDGKKFKSLKRHLSALGMTPNDYRAKWGLPRDYPMVAPGYAARRSQLAIASGLGANRRKKASEPASATQPAVERLPGGDVVEAPVKRRGRPRKIAP